MLFSACLIPFPAEVTMPFSGFLVTTGSFALLPVIIAGTVGDLIGSLIAYYIGYRLEEDVLMGFVRKYGKFILVTEHEFTRARHWFTKHGPIIVFVGKLMPGVRSVIALPAGVAEIKIKKFIPFVFLGTLIWSTILTLVGYYLGKNWQLFGAYFRKFEIVIVILFVLVVVWYVNHKLKIFKFKK
jgi:membrane protein DedA with SNARE-associated domain